MTGAVLFGVAVVHAIACATLAWTYVLRVIGATQAAALAPAVRRAPVAERARALLERAASGSWEHELAADVLAAPDDDARVAAANFALADLDHALRRSSAWPRAALRIGLLGHALLAVAAYLVRPAAPQGVAAVLVAGAVTALACVEARRSGERVAARQRRAVDALLALMFPGAGGSAPPEAPRLAEREQTGRWLGGRVSRPAGEPPYRRRTRRTRRTQTRGSA